MKQILILLLKLIFRVALPYGIILLFTCEVNPLLWSGLCKVIFVVATLVLLSED